MCKRSGGDADGVARRVEGKEDVNVLLSNLLGRRLPSALGRDLDRLDVRLVAYRNDELVGALGTHVETVSRKVVHSFSLREVPGGGAPWPLPLSLADELLWVPLHELF